MNRKIRIKSRKALAVLKTIENFAKKKRDVWSTMYHDK